MLITEEEEGMIRQDEREKVIKIMMEQNHMAETEELERREQELTERLEKAYAMRLVDYKMQLADEMEAKHQEKIPSIQVCENAENNKVWDLCKNYMDMNMEDEDSYDRCMMMMSSFQFFLSRVRVAYNAKRTVDEQDRKAIA